MDNALYEFYGCNLQPKHCKLAKRQYRTQLNNTQYIDTEHYDTQLNNNQPNNTHIS